MAENDGERGLTSEKTGVNTSETTGEHFVDDPSKQQTTTWKDVWRIAQSAPCNYAQIQRLGAICQVDEDTRMLEMANELTLTGECWCKKFGFSAETESPADFFARRRGLNSLKFSQADGANSSPKTLDDIALSASVITSSFSVRYDFIHWTLTEPISKMEILGAGQRIRAALNVNGCLLLTLPVRLGVKGSEEAVNFYQTLTPSPLLLPQEVMAVLEQSGFESLAVEFTNNRQAIARYRMIQNAVNNLPDVKPETKARWAQETKLFLQEGGISFFPSAIFVARRWEYVDGE